MLRGSLWRHPDFLKLWSGQAVSVLGTTVTQLALPTAAILQLHANAFQVGLLAGMQRAPFIFLSLFAGVYVDRTARRPLMIACNLARAALLATVPAAAFARLLTLPQLYAVAFLVGCFTVFFDIAYLAYMPYLVSREQLMEGNTKLQSTYSTADLVGPGIGGLLVQLFGAAQAILADALSYVVAAATLLTIRAAENEIAGSDRTPERMRSEVVAGVRWVLREPVLRSQLIGLTAGGFGLFMVIPIIYVYAYGSLHFSPGLLGALFVLHGAAGLVGLLMSRAVVDRIGLGKTMWLSQLGIAGGVLALPLASFGAAIAVFAAGFTVNGIAEMIQDVNQVTLRQSLTPPSLQGRMNATFRLCYWGAWPVASLLGGALASWLGAADTILAGGSLGLAAAALIAFSPLGRLRLASPLGAEVPAPSDGGGT